jgi:hypothetical protein
MARKTSEATGQSISRSEFKVAGSYSFASSPPLVGVPEPKMPALLRQAAINSSEARCPACRRSGSGNVSSIRFPLEFFKYGRSAAALLSGIKAGGARWWEVLGPKQATRQA